MEKDKILIEGIGGIGGLVAAHLIQNGYDIDLLTNNPDITSKINNDGIELISNGKSENVSANAFTDLEEIPKKNKYSIILLIMKATGVVDAATKSLELLDKAGYMATFQNGIVEYELDQIISGNRIVPVTVGFGSSMIKPGVYEKTSPGGFHLGELKGDITSRIENLSKILSCVDETVMSNNMEGVLWSKLAINCTINTLGAISGQTLGEMLKTREVRDLFLGIYSEVVEVAHMRNVRLEKIATDPYRLYITKDASNLKRFVKDIIVRIVGRKYSNVRSSTLQSIERGRKSEIDYLNGFVVKEADRLGVKVPINQALTNIMRKIDSKELSYKPENIDLLLTELNQP